jgi:hypothetical protein
MHYANTDLALDSALHHLILLLPTGLSSLDLVTYLDNPATSYQFVSLAMRISMLVRRESRVSSRAIQGGNKSNLYLRTGLSDILDHPLQYLDRSVIPIYRDPAKTYKNRTTFTDSHNMVVRSMLLEIQSDAAEAPV